MEGDIGKADKTIKITGIRVNYRFPAPRDKEDVVNRVLDVHPAGCPAHMSVKDSIPVSITMSPDWH